MAAREIHEERGRNMAARRDAAVVVLISAVAAIVCVKLDVSEALLGWTRLHERLQLDELQAVLLVVATCLMWFSARRYFEARRELLLRTSTEDRLADALAENQRLAQQYLDLQEYERKALARDLHDEMGQYLNVIKLDAVSVRNARQTDALVSAAAHAMIENVDRVYGVVSSLIRQLRPVGFDELGMAAALEHCVNDWRSRLPEVSIDCAVDGDAFDDIDEIRALALFRLVQESLTNIARHAQASRVEIRIARRRHSATEEFVDVSISDDGSGADMAAPRSGLGLIGMRERVAAFGGSLRLASRPGEGFEVRASLPAAAAPGTSRRS
ncbi:MAG: integral rane sensor signal transduction histidine kinase [Gammaproteobacteria bacterium]|nr:integral rane sensor signal transduction histidine kinase [Gammaproteobacteria bacterium]